MSSFELVSSFRSRGISLACVTASLLSVCSASVDAVVQSGTLAQVIGTVEEGYPDTFSFPPSITWGSFPKDSIFDRQTGAGTTPSTATAASSSAPAALSGYAEASSTTLRTQSSIDVSAYASNAFFLIPGYFYRGSVESTAAFYDRITVTGTQQPNAVMNLEFHVDGELSRFDSLEQTSLTISAFIYDDVTNVGRGTALANVFRIPFPQLTRSVDEIVTLPVPLPASGTTFTYGVTMWSSVSQSEGEPPFFGPFTDFGLVSSDFDSTATLTGVSFVNASPTAISSGLGVDYLALVPEPAALSLLLLAPLALVRRRR